MCYRHMLHIYYIQWCQTSGIVWSFNYKFIYDLIKMFIIILISLSIFKLIRKVEICFILYIEVTSVNLSDETALTTCRNLAIPITLSVMKW